jgi:hypothetical protein
MAITLALLVAGLRFTVPVLSLLSSRSSGELSLLVNLDKELFLSGTAGHPFRDLLLSDARNVVQTVPAELVVVEVEPLPKSSYSFSAVRIVLFELEEKADVECRGVHGSSSSLRVFKPLSMWKEV